MAPRLDGDSGRRPSHDSGERRYGGLALKILDVAFQLPGKGDLTHERLELCRTSPDVLVVLATASAFDVAKAAEVSEASVILVEDQDAEVRGVVGTEWVQQQVRKYLGTDPHSLMEAVADIEEVGPGSHGFAHEWLNFQDPMLRWCDEGAHFTDRMPCPDHA